MHFKILAYHLVKVGRHERIEYLINEMLNFRQTQGGQT